MIKQIQELLDTSDLRKHICPRGVMIITSNGQIYHYKIEHDNSSHIMGYNLEINDTYVAVKKATLYGLQCFVLWQHVLLPYLICVSITKTLPSPSTQIKESQTFYETLSVNK